MFRIGVIGSGKGSNFQAIASAVSSGRLEGVEVAVVISDNPNAHILERAEKLGVPAYYIAPGKFRTKLEPEIESAYVDTLKRYNVDIVVLAGYMRMVKDVMLNAYAGRIINIHPSLLPAFPGLDSFRQALEYGVKITGCTVHYIDGGMDTGPIIGQRAVAVYDSDTPESLHARIQQQEHILYPACIALIARGKVRLNGRRVYIDGKYPEINNLIK